MCLSFKFKMFVSQNGGSYLLHADYSPWILATNTMVLHFSRPVVVGFHKIVHTLACVQVNWTGTSTTLPTNSVAY